MFDGILSKPLVLRDYFRSFISCALGLTIWTIKNHQRSNPFYILETRISAIEMTLTMEHINQRWLQNPDYKPHCMLCQKFDLRIFYPPPYFKYTNVHTISKEKLFSFIMKT